MKNNHSTYIKNPSPEIDDNLMECLKPFMIKCYIRNKLQETLEKPYFFEPIIFEVKEKKKEWGIIPNYFFGQETMQNYARIDKNCANVS